MQRIILAAAAAVAVLLTGCASTYSAGNFSEQRINADTFRVTFAGNAYTSQEQAFDMQLLRIADTVMAAGFSHFVILSGLGVRMDTARSYVPPTALTTASFGKGYASSITTVSGGHYVVQNRPRADTMVRAFKGQPQALPEGWVVYDAAMICQSTGPKFDAPCVKALAPAI